MKDRDLTSAEAKEAILPDKEEKLCGECCWFYGEDTDGWGQCINQDLCDSMNCSDICTTDKYVSKKEMRHHMAVLLQFNRYRRDDHVPAIYRMPKQGEIGKAIDFAYKYMKVFSKL